MWSSRTRQVSGRRTPAAGWRSRFAASAKRVLASEGALWLDARPAAPADRCYMTACDSHSFRGPSLCSLCVFKCAPKRHERGSVTDEVGRLRAPSAEPCRFLFFYFPMLCGGIPPVECCPFRKIRAPECPAASSAHPHASRRRILCIPRYRWNAAIFSEIASPASRGAHRSDSRRPSLCASSVGGVLPIFQKWATLSLSGTIVSPCVPRNKCGPI